MTEDGNDDDDPRCRGRRVWLTNTAATRVTASSVVFKHTDPGHECVGATHCVYISPHVRLVRRWGRVCEDDEANSVSSVDHGGASTEVVATMVNAHRAPSVSVQLSTSAAVREQTEQQADDRVGSYKVRVAGSQVEHAHSG